MAIKTRNISSDTPAKYFCVNNTVSVTGNATGALLGHLPFACGGTIVDIVITQVVAGDGTSQTLNVLKNGSTVLGTNAVFTAAIGANKSLDAKSNLAALTGCTRPALSTTAATVNVTQGDAFTVNNTAAGVYNTAAVYRISVVIEPKL